MEMAAEEGTSIVTLINIINYERCTFSTHRIFTCFHQKIGLGKIGVEFRWKRCACQKQVIEKAEGATQQRTDRIARLLYWRAPADPRHSRG